MASRTITGLLPTYPRSTVRFRQLATFVTASATYPAREYPASTDSAGAFTIALPIPDTGTVAYLIELPDGTAAAVNLGDGAATTLELLLAGAFAVGSVPDVLTVLATLIAEHAAIEASTTVLGHVTVDGTTIVSVDGVLTSTGGVLSGAAGGVLAGNYPNPSFAADMATQAELDAEASARGSADTTNASAITAEASARASADSTLQTNITSEASARSAADTTLQTNITSEASTRASADTTLQTNITAEISARAAADSAHVVAGDPHPQYQTQIEGDARYYQLATDLATQAELDAEATARASADTTNAGALTTHEADTTAVHGITDTTTLYRAGGTDVSVADGGTGASTAAGARTNLGLVIGTDVAAIASPALTGTPTVPTAAPGTNSTQAASTAFVALAVGSSGAPIELGYAAITADNTTASDSMVDVSGLSITITVGSRAIMVEFQAGEAYNSTDAKRCLVEIYDTTGSARVQLGIVTSAAAGSGNPMHLQARLAPSAGSRSYKIRMQRGDSAGAGTIRASATGPAFIRAYEV